MTPPRLLVAGIGNIFHGDDGFGVELAQRLSRRPRPDGVRVVDFGIRGRDLAYELLDGVGGLLILDAMARGGPPGMLYDPDCEGEMGLSPAVHRAVDEAVPLAESLIADMLVASGGECHA
jgi:Ni,Fe-hydrogenase maturation factor